MLSAQDHLVSPAISVPGHRPPISRTETPRSLAHSAWLLPPASSRFKLARALPVELGRPPDPLAPLLQLGLLCALDLATPPPTPSRARSKTTSVRSQPS